MPDILLVESPSHAQHNPPVEYEGENLIEYRESPDRVENIRRHLLALGIVQPVLPPDSGISGLLAEVHAAEYLEALQELSAEARRQGRYLYPSLFAIRGEMAALPPLPHGLLARHSMDAGSPVGPATWPAALGAARAAAHAAELLVANRRALVYALCRPPGHHAGRDFMGGYCYLNNAAVAAAALKRIGRVAIVDVDVHHGNGTQSIFWDDPEVFFLSLHGHPRFEYPYYSGFEGETGSPGAHTTLNIPLEKGTAGGEYLVALRRGLNTLAHHSPDALVISLGFDAYRRDPWGAFQLEIEDFARIAAVFAELALPTVLIQEGGYATPDLPRLAEAFLRGWEGGAS